MRSITALWIIYLLFFNSVAFADSKNNLSSRSVTIGILSYKSKDQMLSEWGHVKKILESNMERIRVIIKILNVEELTKAVAQKEVDFVLTNPAHYVILKKDFGLSYPVATLVNSHKGRSLNSFGGVIFTRASNIFVKDIHDLKNRKIAITNKESFGGYQMQTYELREDGLGLDDEQLVIGGMPHEKVVNAVSKQLVDVGFVRSGILESMEKQGKINLRDFRIINQKSYDDFDLAVSTKLYAEWPLSVVTKMNQDIAREIISNLFLIDKLYTVPSNVSFCCFDIPGDYSIVEDMLRQMRFPPFDTSKHFSLLEVWEKYKIEISLMLLVIILLLVAALRRALIANSDLKESKERFNRLHNASFGGIAIHNHGKILDCNQGLVTLFGYSMDELLGMDGLLLIAESHRRVVLDNIKNKSEKPYEVLGIKKNRETFPMRVEAREMPYGGKSLRVVELRDISAQKKSEEKLKLAAKVFSHAREAILITDTNGAIIDVNQSFTHITGFSKEEVMGKNPRILKSGMHDENFYAQIWKDLHQKGHWYGEIWNKRKNGELYVELVNITSIKDDYGEVKQYLSIFSDITAIKEHEKELEHMAHYDALTSLPNRLLLRDRLDQAIMNAKRTGLRICVVYLDLDGFKLVNDAYGHEIGDKFLVAISHKLKLALRQGDTISRLGGDEFVIVMQNLIDDKTYIPMLERLLSAASSSSKIEDIFLRVSASIGVSFYPQQEDVDADTLLRQADQAMYKAKVSGKNRYSVFDSLEDQTIRGYHQSLENIKKALDNDEFILHYQPKIDMASSRVVGFEALIRWSHPQEGILFPGEFLPTLQNHPIELEVGDWVIKEALRQLTIWKQAGLDTQVSVNIGAKQLQQSGFASYLKETLAEFPDILPANLQIELLETSAMEELTRVSNTIKECQKIGVTFALDDFGTGYSSLAYLKQLPVETLKIDQSFVRDMLHDPNDLAIIEGIISLAKAFRHHVIAEGVETREDGIVLRKLGCEHVQGYYIAKPMAADEILSWVGEWKMDKVWQETQHIDSDDYSLLFALVDHNAWINTILHQNDISGRQKIDLDINGCAFGKWFDGDGQKYFDQEKRSVMDLLHKKIHHIAYDLLHLSSHSDEMKIIQKRKELQGYSHELLQKMLTNEC